jgi:hypothetical protein
MFHRTNRQLPKKKKHVVSKGRQEFWHLSVCTDG